MLKKPVSCQYEPRIPHSNERYEATKVLRSEGLSVPIVALTANVMNGEIFAHIMVFTLFVKDGKID